MSGHPDPWFMLSPTRNRAIPIASPSVIEPLQSKSPQVVSVPLMLTVEPSGGQPAG